MSFTNGSNAETSPQLSVGQTVVSTINCNYNRSIPRAVQV